MASLRNCRCLHLYPQQWQNEPSQGQQWQDQQWQGQPSYGQQWQSRGNGSDSANPWNTTRLPAVAEELLVVSHSPHPPLPPPRLPPPRIPPILPLLLLVSLFLFILLVFVVLFLFLLRFILLVFLLFFLFFSSSSPLSSHRDPFLLSWDWIGVNVVIAS